MTRIVLAAFLIAHGLLHPAIHSVPEDPNKPAPFNPNHSWAFAAVHVADRKARVFGVGVSWLTALAFVAAGIALFIQSPLWVSIAACGAVLGLSVKALFFHPCLILGVLIDIGILGAATEVWPGSLT